MFSCHKTIIIYTHCIKKHLIFDFPIIYATAHNTHIIFDFSQIVNLNRNHSPESIWTNTEFEKKEKNNGALFFMSIDLLTKLYCKLY